MGTHKTFKIFNSYTDFTFEILEVLFIKGHETALVNPNGFPWFNLKLNPVGSRMTKNQHHTIIERTAKAAAEDATQAGLTLHQVGAS